jgi:multicomponent Na+:H+ antiporter subunit E
MTFYPRDLLLIPVFAALWWLLTDGAPDSWLLGLPAVLAASWWTQRLRCSRSGTISWLGLLRFIPMFLWESLRGGIDVTRRVLAPRLRLQPGFLVYQTRLREPPARVFFANCMCLLPGTLAAELDGQRLNVHLLDATIDNTGELRRLEHAVARIYRQSDKDEPSRSDAS